MQRGDNQKEAQRSYPAHYTAGPVFFRQATGMKEESLESSEDRAIEVSELMHQFVDEVPDGGSVSLISGLSARSAIRARQRLAAITTAIAG